MDKAVRIAMAQVAMRIGYFIIAPSIPVIRMIASCMLCHNPLLTLFPSLSTLSLFLDQVDELAFVHAVSGGGSSVLLRCELRAPTRLPFGAAEVAELVAATAAAV